MRMSARSTPTGRNPRTVVWRPPWLTMAKASADRFEFVFGYLTAPVALQRELEFALFADAGEARDVGANHEVPCSR